MKKKIIKIFLSVMLLVIALTSPLEKFTNISIGNIELNGKYINIIIYILSYLIVGFEVIKKAVRNIFRGKIFDENFLMTVATIGAFGIKEFPEAVGVMLFYQIGETFQSYAVNKSRKSISSLVNIRPDYANINKDGTIVKVEPDDVKVGEEIIVKPGEKVPLDGVIVDGESLIDTSVLTGESVPRKVKKDDEILSGAINQNGVLTIKVTKEFGASTVNKILELVENASSKKSKSENFISKFAKYYTPIVVGAAVLLAFVPPIFLGWDTLSDWMYRALTFLVVSCPCALVVSIPMGFFGGIGGASKIGILIKGSNYLEALSNTEFAVFDKTGTLTKGVFDVQMVEISGDIDKEELLKLASYAESFSSHPIAISIRNAYGKEVEQSKVTELKEISGYGISANVDGKKVLVGNKKLMEQNNVEYIENNNIGTVIYVAVDDSFKGSILISDKIKDDSKKAIDGLKKYGIKKTIMLTGDRTEVANDVAKKLKLDDVYAELLPNEKAEKVEQLLKNKSEKGKLIFVGDGINDAPVLALSDVGIAMGGVGSDAAIEAADVVIMTDEPSKIVNAINIAKKTMKIVKENIAFAIGVKIAVLVLSAFGLSNMWEAVFADVGVLVIAIINSLRTLNVTIGQS